jgi:hypothetical protein
VLVSSRWVPVAIESRRRYRGSLGALLPRGDSLSEESWRRRHRSICVLLWLHVPVLALFGAVNGHGLVHSALEASIVGALALGASMSGASRRQRAVMATLGLLSSSAILIHFSHGLIEMHFHFFVMVAVVSLYQSWLPFLVALGYVTLQHGAFGVLAPASCLQPSLRDHPSMDLGRNPRSFHPGRERGLSGVLAPQ